MFPPSMAPTAFVESEMILEADCRFSKHAASTASEGIAGRRMYCSADAFPSMEGVVSLGVASEYRATIPATAAMTSIARIVMLSIRYFLFIGILLLLGDECIYDVSGLPWRSRGGNREPGQPCCPYREIPQAGIVG